MRFTTIHQSRAASFADCWKYAEGHMFTIGKKMCKGGGGGGTWLRGVQDSVIYVSKAPQNEQQNKFEYNDENYILRESKSSSPLLVWITHQKGAIVMLLPTLKLLPTQGSSSWIPIKHHDPKSYCRMANWSLVLNLIHSNLTRDRYKKISCPFLKTMHFLFWEKQWIVRSSNHLLQNSQSHSQIQCLKCTGGECFQQNINPWDKAQWFSCLINNEPKPWTTPCHSPRAESACTEYDSLNPLHLEANEGTKTNLMPFSIAQPCRTCTISISQLLCHFQ